MDLRSKLGTYLPLGHLGVAMEERGPLDWVGAALLVSFWEGFVSELDGLFTETPASLLVYSLLRSGI